MPTSYTRAESDVTNRVVRVIQDHHPELAKVELTVDVLFAFNEDGDAVLLHGYKCAAVVRKVSYKNRVLGRGDAEIVIDQDYWQDATEKQKDALLDHELTHIELQTSKKSGAVKRDRAGRPKLVMRLHDWQLGGFEEIAQRYGKDAPEVALAREFKQKFGQFVFDFAKGK